MCASSAAMAIAFDRGRRHPDDRPPRHVVVRVTAASCRRSRCRRPFVAVASSSVSPPLPSLSRLPTGLSPAVVAALAAASPCHRVVVVRAEADRRAFERRRRAPARRRPSSSSRAPRSPLVVCASSPPRRRRSLSSSSSRAAFAVIVAAVLVVNTLGHGSRCRCVVVRVVSVVISVLAAIAGYHRLVVTVVRRPSPPLSSPHPSSCSATLPPASLTWDWDVTRRRCRVVVVLAAALWSSSSSGLVLAAAGWQCFDVGAGHGDRTRRDPGTKHEGHTGTSDSSILQ